MRYLNLAVLRCLNGYKELLIILLIVVINFPVLAQVASPSKILLTFSEPMARETIFDPANYKVIANENISVEVIKVGLVEGDSAVVLFINKENNWLSFQITVQNLKDKAGNLINTEKNYANIQTEITDNSSVVLLGDK
jgi:hypothetical protein